MSLFVSAVGGINAPGGIVSIDKTPSTHTVDQRLMQAQSELIDKMGKGVYTGPIDEERLMQAMYYAGPSPAEWTAQEAAMHQAVRDQATTFWDQKGKQAKDRWLNEPKRSESIANPPDSESQPAQSNTNDLNTMVNLAQTDRAPFTEVEPEKMNFLDAMKPATIKKAYQNIMVDLRRWDELPQATALEKAQSCFLSPERIGAIVCSCILMIILITFVVILTM